MVKTNNESKSDVESKSHDQKINKFSISNLTRYV
jgi:hypothetical protein